MARLSEILGAILRDMVSAQHEANMYALKLSSAYRDQNRAASLNPPAVCLGEMELVLRCGFSGETVSGETFEIDQMSVLRTLWELSAAISEGLVNGILSTVSRHKGRPADGEGPVARLNKDKKLRKNFIAFLNRQFYGYLKGHRAEIIAMDGSIDYGRLQAGILFVADDKILGHSELREAVMDDPSGGLQRAIREKMQADLQLMLPRLLKGVQIGRTVKYISQDVTVSSEALSKLPDACIQTLRLKISPRDLPLETETE